MLDTVHFLDGGGKMAQEIRAYDWSSHPLGLPDTWSTPLKIALSMALNSKYPKCIVWGQGLFAFPNDAFLPILGRKPSALGRSFRDVWSEAWGEIGPIAERAYAGEATFIEDFPLVVDRYDYPEKAYFTFCYSPIRDENGVVRGIIDTVIETTEKIETQRRAQLLNDELEHRIKNLLSVISAIINQTLRRSTSPAAARQALTQRIAALAESQTLLTGASLAGADIREVVNRALAPFRTSKDRFHVSGPSVRLTSRQVLSLALALNELATNAMKYGALSIDGGDVYLSWVIGEHNDDPFCLTWCETGGPPVARPRRRGFGTEIIEQVLAGDFMGKATLDHAPGGLRCELVTQMAHLGDGPLQQKMDSIHPASLHPAHAQDL